MKCPFCGAELLDGAPFCDMCGNVMELPPDPNAQPEQVPPPELHGQPGQVPPPETYVQSGQAPPPEPYSQPGSTPPPMGYPYGQSPYAPGYGAQTAPKKSPVVPILIAVVVVLAITGGVLLFILLSGDKDKDGTTDSGTVAATEEPAKPVDAATPEPDKDDDTVTAEPAEDTEDDTEAKSDESMAGDYKLVGSEMFGAIMDSRDAADKSKIVLKDDGTGSFDLSDGSSMKLLWKVDGTNVTITDENGDSLVEKMGMDANGSIEYKDGLLWFRMTQYGEEGATIFARDGADLSGLDLMSPEEFNEKYGDKYRELIKNNQ